MRKKAFVKQYMQYRTEDLKSLTEQRADLVQQMKELTSTAETEKRAFSPEEDTQFDELDKQVKALDSTIEKMERARDIKLNITSTKKHEELEKEGFAVSQAGRGTFVSMGNLELLRDSKRRIIEQDLQKAVHNAKLFDIAKDDLYAMLDILYEED